MRLAIISIVLLSAPLAASAEMIVNVESKTLPYSATDQTGSFEIFLTNVGSPAPKLIAYQLQLSISPADSGLSITGVEKPVIHEYLFSSSSPVGSTVPTSKNLSAGDYLLSGYVQPVENAGLLKVDFNLSGNATMPDFDIVVNTDPSKTYFKDDSYANLSFSVVNGNIVPEPNVAMMLFAAFCCYGFQSALKRRVTARKPTTAGSYSSKPAHAPIGGLF
jgi:hypothetical protein